MKSLLFLQVQSRIEGRTSRRSRLQMQLVSIHVMSILPPAAHTRASPSCVMSIELFASRCPRTSLVWSLSLGSSAGTGTAASPLFARSGRHWPIVTAPAPLMVCVTVITSLMITPIPVAMHELSLVLLPAAPAAFPLALLTSLLPIYLALSTLNSAEAEVEMSDEDFVPSQLDVESDAFGSMDEVASEDEEVVRAALQPSPLRSPRHRRKRRRRVVSPTPPLEPVDKDLSVGSLRKQPSFFAQYPGPSGHSGRGRRRTAVFAS